MDSYPYSHLIGSDAAEEGRVYVNLEVQPDGVNIDEMALIQAIKEFMLAQAGVASVTATHLEVTSTNV